MYTTIKIAYIQFINENPECKVGFSTFNKLKPENVEISSKTPLISSLCPYCHNLRLKLQKLNITNLRTEYDLFDQLICKTNDGELANASCIKKNCKKCCDWEGKIEELLSSVDKEDTDLIVWYTWKQKEYIRKNGMKGVCRELILQKETFEKFKQELLDDILKPLQRCTFVEHFFSKKYQNEMYAKCKLTLKPGQCLIVQDFAKNRDIVFQDEIKSNFWTKKQVTLHPSVLIYRLTDNEHEPVKKIVISHLSDIKNHDAHLVHCMTQDCISILKNKHPEIEWYRFIVWTDGCSSQYKGKHAFYYLDKYSVSLERNYFASEHGKGPSDAETGRISMYLHSAVKSRRAVLHDAKSMCDFLIENHSDDTHLYKLVNQGDLDVIMNNFKGVTVITLQGKCTRTLHQIMRSKRSGFLKQRPFSCSCAFCESNNCNNCLYKDYTGGNFKVCKLPTNTLDENIDEEDNGDIYDDADLNLNGMLDEDSEQIIKVTKEELMFENLNVGDFFVVAIPTKKKDEYSHWVYKITKLDEEENEIYGQSFKQEYDHHDVFKETLERVQEFDLNQILMILPEPLETRKRYVFSGHIELKNNIKMCL